MLRGEGALPDDEIVDRGVEDVAAVRLAAEEQLGIEDRVGRIPFSSPEQGAVDPDLLGTAPLHERIQVPGVEVIGPRRAGDALVGTAATTGVPDNGAIGPRYVSLGGTDLIVSNRPECAGVRVAVVLLPNSDGDVVIHRGDVERVVGTRGLDDQLALVGLGGHDEALAELALTGGRDNGEVLDLTGITADH